MVITYKITLLKYLHRQICFTKSKKYAYRFFLACFIVGTLAFFVYVNAFGGYFNALIRAEFLRNFGNAATDVIPYSAALMQLPSALVTASPLFYIIWVGDVGVWRFKNKVFFIILLFISISYLLLNAGKTGLILFILPIWLTFISYRIKHEWIITIVCCVLGVSVINILDYVFLSFTNESMMLSDDSVKPDFSLLHQFAYPISNSLNMHEILQNNDMRLFKDFITGILTHVPGLNFEVSYEPTSAFYGGVDWRESGGVPNDILTFGYLQLGPLGVIVVGFIWGYLLGGLDYYLMNRTNSFADKFIKYSLILTAFNAVMNADIATLVVNFKFSLLVFFIYKSISRLRCSSSSRI